MAAEISDIKSNFGIERQEWLEKISQCCMYVINVYPSVFHTGGRGRKNL